MVSRKGNPLGLEALAGESRQGVDDAAALPVRLNRYSRAHHRALEMSHYASEKGDVKIARKLTKCGEYLLFRDYYTVGKVRLHSADFCKKHLLCPLCAIRRGAKMVKAYLDRLAVIHQQKPHLKAYLVTVTVKDGPDLLERFEHLARSLRKLHKTRHGKGQVSEAEKASGAVWSYEFKRGKNSGEWHPHVHAVWLCDDAPDEAVLSRQWKEITGDSHVVNVKPFEDQGDVVGGFLEVFKYAVKFSDLPLADNWEGFQKLAGKRLIASFGDFRGVDVPDSLADEQLDDLPFVELLFKFHQGAGYSLLPGKSGAASVPPGATPNHNQPQRGLDHGYFKFYTGFVQSVGDIVGRLPGTAVAGWGERWRLHFAGSGRKVRGSAVPDGSGACQAWPGGLTHHAAAHGQPGAGEDCPECCGLVGRNDYGGAGRWLEATGSS